MQNISFHEQTRIGGIHMGLRFRKSINIAPGIKLNLNKKSAGLTFGTKGFHHTINTKGRRTDTVGIPGTGLSYTHTSGNTSKKHTASSRSQGNQHREKAKNPGTPPLDNNGSYNDDRSEEHSLTKARCLSMPNMAKAAILMSTR